MNNDFIPYLISIILGLIIIIFPLTGVIAINLVIAAPIIILGLLFFFMGSVGDNGKLQVMAGILIIVLGIFLILFPGLFAFIISFILSLVGILLIVNALVSLIRKSKSVESIGGMVIAGIIYFIFGYVLRDPLVLGVLLGLTLIIFGFLGILKKDNLPV